MNELPNLDVAKALGNICEARKSLYFALKNYDVEFKELQEQGIVRYCLILHKNPDNVEAKKYLDELLEKYEEKFGSILRKEMMGM